MPRSPRAWQPLVGWGVLLVVSIVVLGRLGWAFVEGDLERNDQLASVISMVVGLGSLGVAIVGLRLQLRPSAALVDVDDAARLDQAAEALAAAVMAQWEAEAGLRELRRPAPLRLTWTSTRRSVAASAQTIAGRAVGGRVTRLRLRGHLEEVAEKFLDLPQRRLVVLGAPGAGKTALAVLLTLALLERRRAGEPIPVLLGVASWNPATEHLHAWMVRRMEEDYPALGGRVDGQAVAQRLVTSERVLPVLDGLDELPERLRATAISALDHARAGKPLVVTCRSVEYEQTVTAGGEILAAAAVVELEPVTATEALAFLRAAGPTADGWERIAAEMHAAPDGALAAALSTPLMIALARTVYTHPGHDPGELVTLARKQSQGAVERHLLDAFVPAAFTDRPPAPDVVRQRRWDPALADRWLRTLAFHCHQQHSYDLAWWQVVGLVPGCTVRLLRAIASLIMMGLPIGIGIGLMGGVKGFAVGLMLGLLPGVLRAVPPGKPLVTGREAHPVRVPPLRRISTFAKDLKEWLVLGFVLGSAGGLAVGILATPAEGFSFGLWAIFNAGVVCWLMTVVSDRLHEPVDAAHAAAPSTILRSDRSAAIASATVLGIAGFASMAASGFSFGSTAVLAPGVALGLGLGLETGHSTAYGVFTIARTWLALRGRLPWRLMRFLEDAHRRGVLRQAGAVYQFRHARLQDRLAEVGQASR